MSRIHLGYGSEWHLLRFLGRHRQYFTDRVLAVTGGTSIEWCDFGFTGGITAKENYGGAELKGMDFLPADHPARSDWAKWWPQTGNLQKWDAVGLLRRDGTNEWLLVEAKGNTEELESATGAKQRGGLPVIRQRLTETQRALGADPKHDWTKPYYQYANRLAVLHFLSSHQVAALLLFVYFTGDRTPNRTCPTSASGWRGPLNKMKVHVRSARFKTEQA